MKVGGGEAEANLEREADGAGGVAAARLGCTPHEGCPGGY